jgi:hypothetical protein
MAVMMRSRVSGFASAGFATSPATRAMSSWRASRSGTFSPLPLVLRGCTRSVGSWAFTISANASP